MTELKNGQSPLVSEGMCRTTYYGTGFKIIQVGEFNLENVLRAAVGDGSVDTLERFLKNPDSRDQTERILLSFFNNGKDVLKLSREKQIENIMVGVRKTRQHLLDHPRPGNNRPPDILKRLR